MFNFFKFDNNKIEVAEPKIIEKIDWASMEDADIEKQIRNILTDVTYDDQVMDRPKSDIGKHMEETLQASGLQNAKVIVSDITHSQGGVFASCIATSPKTGNLIKIQIGD